MDKQTQTLAGQTGATTKTGQPLQAKPFSNKVTLIPDFAGGEFTGMPYKAELVLIRGEEGGCRQHVWFAADPRPHNHPWEFIDCKVIRGAYKAIEYRPDGNGGFTVHEVVLRAGDPEHRVGYETHHQIVEVVPGTTTLMSFGPIVGDGKQWGNLVKEGDTFRYEPNSTPPGFVDALRHLNPHMRPAGWVDPYAEMPIPNIDELMASVGL